MFYNVFSVIVEKKNKLYNIGIQHGSTKGWFNSENIQYAVINYNLAE